MIELAQKISYFNFMDRSTTTTSIVSSMILVWIGHFIVDFMLGIWPVYKTMIGFDLTQAGFIMAFCAIVGEGCQPFVGLFTDRGYGRELILMGVLLTLSAALFSYSVDFGVLISIVLMIYIGSGIFHPAAAGLVGSLSQSNRGLLVTVFASGGALGMALSQLIFSRFYIIFEGHTLFIAIPGLLLIGWALFSYRSPIPKVETSGHLDLKTFIGFFGNPHLLLTYIILLCNSSVTWGLIFLLPDVLKERSYDSWLYFGAGHFAFVLGGASTMILGGYLSDKYGEKKVLTVCTILSAFLFYTFLFYETLSPLGVLSLLYGLGAFMYTIAPLGISLGTRLVPSSPGKISAFMMGMVWIVSESLGPGLSGLLTNLFTESVAGKSLAFLGLLMVIAIGCAFKLPLFEKQKEKVKI